MKAHGIVTVFCLLVGAQSSLVAQGLSFTTVYLPKWQGKTLEPKAMNDRGQVVGYIRLSDNKAHLFLWDQAGGARDLGEVHPKGCDINNAGQIVANRVVTIKTARTTGKGTQTFLRQPNGIIEVVDDSRISWSIATSINNNGQIAGWGVIDDGGAVAFVWDSKQGTLPLAKRWSRADAISDAGQVLGHKFETDRPQPLSQPWYWEPDGSSGYTPVKAPDGIFCDMSNGGWVVGKRTYADGRSYIVLWQGFGGIRKLFPCDSEAVFERSTWRVNNADQVACILENRFDASEGDGLTNPRPRDERYLWDPVKGKIPLEPCLPPQTSRFELIDLNNQGCILGVAHLRHGNVLPVLLELIPSKN